MINTWVKGVKPEKPGYYWVILEDQKRLRLGEAVDGYMIIYGDKNPSHIVGHNTPVFGTGSFLTESKHFEKLWWTPVVMSGVESDVEELKLTWETEDKNNRIAYHEEELKKLKESL
jgi:hypothetical protein